MASKKNKWLAMTNQLKTMADQEWNKRQARKETYLEEMPTASSLSKEKAAQLSDYLFQFKKDWNENAKQKILKEELVVKSFYDFLVPDEVSEKDFWQRYSWRCDRTRILKDFEALPKDEFAKLVEAASEHTQAVKSRVWALPSKKTAKIPEILKSPIKPVKPTYDRSTLLKKKVIPPPEESLNMPSSGGEVEINPLYTSVLKKNAAEAKRQQQAMLAAQEIAAERPQDFLSGSHEKTPSTSPTLGSPTRKSANFGKPDKGDVFARPEDWLGSPSSARRSWKPKASLPAVAAALDLENEKNTDQVMKRGEPDKSAQVSLLATQSCKQEVLQPKTQAPLRQATTVDQTPTQQGSEVEITKPTASATLSAENKSEEGKDIMIEPEEILLATTQTTVPPEKAERLQKPREEINRLEEEKRASSAHPGGGESLYGVEEDGKNAVEPQAGIGIRLPELSVSRRDEPNEVLVKAHLASEKEPTFWVEQQSITKSVEAGEAVEGRHPRLADPIGTMETGPSTKLSPAAVSPTAEMAETSGAESSKSSTPVHEEKNESTVRNANEDVALGISRDVPDDHQHKLIVLVSKASGTLSQRTNQDRATTMLNGKGIPFDEVDGSDPEQKDFRNKLFDLSKIRGNYPQFFVTDGRITTFLGNFEAVQAMNEAGTLFLSSANLGGAGRQPVASNGKSDALEEVRKGDHSDLDFETASVASDIQSHEDANENKLPEAHTTYETMDQKPQVQEVGTKSPVQVATEISPRDIFGAPMSPTDRIAEAPTVPDKASILSKLSESFLSPGTLKQIGSILDKKAKQKEEVKAKISAPGLACSSPGKDSNINPGTGPETAENVSDIETQNMMKYNGSDGKMDVLKRISNAIFSPNTYQKTLEMEKEEKILLLKEKLKEMDLGLEGDLNAQLQTQDFLVKQAVEESSVRRGRTLDSKSSQSGQVGKMKSEKHADVLKRVSEVLFSPDMYNRTFDFEREETKLILKEKLKEVDIDLDHAIQKPEQSREMPVALVKEKSAIPVLDGSDRDTNEATATNEVDSFVDLRCKKSEETEGASDSTTEARGLIDKVREHFSSPLPVEHARLEAQELDKYEDLEGIARDQAEEASRESMVKTGSIEKVALPSTEENQDCDNGIVKQPTDEVKATEPPTGTDETNAAIEETDVPTTEAEAARASQGKYCEPMFEEIPKHLENADKPVGSNEQGELSITHTMPSSYNPISTTEAPKAEEKSLVLFSTYSAKEPNRTIRRTTPQEREEKRQRVKALVQQLDSTLQESAVRQ